MSTGKNPTPLEERLSNAYFYEMKTVKKTRKSKSCGICNGDIPAGSEHRVATIYEAEHYPLNICSYCESLHKEDIEKMCRHELDENGSAL